MPALEPVRVRVRVLVPVWVQALAPVWVLVLPEPVWVLLAPVLRHWRWSRD